MDPREDLKRRVGYAAADLVADGETVGLGTGSTAVHMVRRLGERVKEGLRIRGVPTSLATEKLAREVGVPLVSLDDVAAIDITIDGADEVDPALDLVKGLGGALLREKVVASITKRQVIIVDASKLVDQLGTKAPLPVEVVPFAAPVVARRLAARGWKGEVRRKDGAEFRTDNGNLILDVQFGGPILDARRVEADLHAMPGVVETGLFLGMTERVLVGEADGSVRTIRRGG